MNKLSLEKITRGSRRDFLKQAGRLAAAAALYPISAFLQGCGSYFNFDSIESAGKVNQTFEVYNHSTGENLGTLVYENLDAGSEIEITLDSFAASGIQTSEIDRSVLAARRQVNEGKIGEFISNTENGNLRVAAENDTKIIYGMNITNGADYSASLKTPYFARKMPHGRFVSVNLLDKGKIFPYVNESVTDSSGSLDVIKTSIKKLNEALEINRVQYARINFEPNNSQAEVRTGFFNDSTNYFGFHLKNEYVHNLKTPEVLMIPVGVEELFETLFGFDDLFGADSHKTLFRVGEKDICPLGKDYIAFAGVFSH